MSSEKTLKLRRYLAISLLAATIILSVAGSVLLIQHWEYITQLENQGMLGLFLISIFAGSPIPIPSPSMILTFTMGSIFNPALVALVSGFGNSIGQVLVYLTGRGGTVFFKNLGFTPKKGGDNENSWWNRLGRKIRFPKMQEFARRQALLAVFVLGMYPNPILMPIIMSMGQNSRSSDPVIPGLFRPPFPAAYFRNSGALKSPNPPANHFRGGVKPAILSTNAVRDSSGHPRQLGIPRSRPGRYR
jgi:membrane protein YqaA with SNARE-associated domain